MRFRAREAWPPGEFRRVGTPARRLGRRTTWNRSDGHPVLAQSRSPARCATGLPRRGARSRASPSSRCSTTSSSVVRARHHALEPPGLLRLLRRLRVRPPASWASCSPRRSTSTRWSGRRRRRPPSSRRWRSDWLRAIPGAAARHSTGVINDTASVSSLHALAAARERGLPDGAAATGLAGRDLPRQGVRHVRAPTRRSPSRCTRSGWGADGVRRVAAGSDRGMDPARARRMR